MKGERICIEINQPEEFLRKVDRINVDKLDWNNLEQPKLYFMYDHTVGRFPFLVDGGGNRQVDSDGYIFTRRLSKQEYQEMASMWLEIKGIVPEVKSPSKDLMWYRKVERRKR